MPFVSVTRLRIRSVRFLPAFAWHTLRSLNQVRKAQGFRGGSLLPDRDWTFWTITAWDHEDDMRRYMSTGHHRAAMPHLLNWCDEASVVHWTQNETALPSWSDADMRMRREGRPSKVRRPSPQHAGLDYAPARIIPTATINPKTMRAPHNR